MNIERLVTVLNGEGRKASAADTCEQFLSGVKVLDQLLRGMFQRL